MFARCYRFFADNEIKPDALCAHRAFKFFAFNSEARAALAVQAFFLMLPLGKILENLSVYRPDFSCGRVISFLANDFSEPFEIAFCQTQHFSDVDPYLFLERALLDFCAGVPCRSLAKKPETRRLGGKMQFTLAHLQFSSLIWLYCHSDNTTKKNLKSTDPLAVDFQIGKE